MKMNYLEITWYKLNEELWFSSTNKALIEHIAYSIYGPMEDGAETDGCEQELREGRKTADGTPIYDLKLDLETNTSGCVEFNFDPTKSK